MPLNNRVNPYIGNEILEFLLFKQMEIPEMAPNTYFDGLKRICQIESGLGIRDARQERPPCLREYIP